MKEYILCDSIYIMQKSVVEKKKKQSTDYFVRVEE